MIFADTSGWFALFVSNDPHSSRIRKWIQENPEQTLLTTDYIIDELLTLLRARNEHGRSLNAGAHLFSGEISVIEFVTPVDVEAAWNVFRTFHDKDWSFTDCTSRVVMQRLKINTALASDEHFRQFGTVRVVP